MSPQWPIKRSTKGAKTMQIVAMSAYFVAVTAMFAAAVISGGNTKF